MTNIFVTVGTQLPFVRLIEIINEWSMNEQVNIIAQTCGSECNSENIQVIDFCSPSRYQEIIKNTDIIIAHAGMGTIISAHENNIPVIVFPRRYELNEHRNDHQIATANKFTNTDGVYVAYEKSELISLLNNVDKLKPAEVICNKNRLKILSYIKNIIDNENKILA